MHLDTVLDDLRRLVEVESPSNDPPALHASAAVVAELLEGRLGGSAAVGADGRVRWTNAGPDEPAVLLLGHHDTVWPLGTLERLPFAVANGRITGPGVFDMKSGIVVAVHALAALASEGAAPAVRVLLTTDEEVGSLASRDEIEAEARRCGRVLVLEPCGANGAVKTARKGVSLGRLACVGRASHAGLAPLEGINAAVGLASVLTAVDALGDAAAGTTVTPTTVTAGTTVNTVPARAEATLDVRFFDEHELDRVRAGLEALRPTNGATLEVDLPLNRPALPPSASAPLLPALRSAALEAGQEVGTVSVGGASDGNLAAAVGAAVLDGLGPDGDGAHADHEHVTVLGLERRVALLRRLLPHVADVEVP
ncbi:MAG: M20/M25/M40 family metallo-hydrolase [Actinobacteria bacterium]|nr:M20/M25/M40 family metallo-hydrolase [Actinomycetota bacterium]